MRDRDRAFGILSERETRNAEHGRFLLNPTGISQYQLGIGNKAHEVQIADRIHTKYAA